MEDYEDQEDFNSVKVNSAKGRLKDYNYWLEDELDDFSNIPEYNPKTKKFLAQLNHHFTHKYTNVVFKAQKVSIIDTKKTVPPSKAHSLMFWASIKENVCLKIASFLTDRELTGLLITCKILNSKFDVPMLWEMLYDRNLRLTEEDLKSGFKRSQNFAEYSIKQLYKYRILLSVSGVLYYSNSLITNVIFDTHQLIRYLVDFVFAPKLIFFLNKYSNIKDSTKDLKLSLLRETMKSFFGSQALKILNYQHKTVINLR